MDFQSPVRAELTHTLAERRRQCAYSGPGVEQPEIRLYRKAEQSRHEPGDFRRCEKLPLQLSLFR